jgi:hypothetical protein
MHTGFCGGLLGLHEAIDAVPIGEGEMRHPPSRSGFDQLMGLRTSIEKREARSGHQLCVGHLPILQMY